MADTVANPATINPTKEELFLGRLKNDTALLHRKLEQSPLSAVLMSPAITANDYALYLGAMRNVNAWWEETIYPMVGAVIVDLDTRKKLTTLDDDLKNLKSFTTKPSHAPAFSPAPPSKLSTAIGFMYVLEGSSLGGMVIVKQLQQQSFLNQDTSHFLTVYGKNTGTYWKKFLREMCSFAIDNSAEDEIIDGAKDAFRAIDNYFCSIRPNS